MRVASSFETLAGRRRLTQIVPSFSSGKNSDPKREAKAHRLCAECTVKEACKDFARNSREYGYWGGENEEDRHLAGFTVAAPIGIRAREARF